MKYSELKKETYKLNLKLVENGLVLFTWGNASILDKEKGVYAIKPSGIPYKDMTSADIVIIDLEGKIVDGKRKPSSDTPTHTVLYNNFKEIGAIIHTHSTHATAFAQANIPIKCLGTTHADHFYGEIPVTRKITNEETQIEYEKNTGLLITELFQTKKINPLNVPAVLVANHGPFVWGINAQSAIYNATVLEHVALMNLETMKINEKISSIDKFLLDKHYKRKNGPDSYYGQK